MDRQCNIIADNGCEQKISCIKPKITEENLIKISNKGIYKRGVKDAETIDKAEISYNDGMIKVKFNDIEASVKEDFTGVVCSCQSKTVCRHIITALIIISECEVSEQNTDVQISENPVEEITEEIKAEPEKSIEINSLYLEEVMKFISSIMQKGFINCNESDIDIATQLSVKGENTVHNNISLMLRTISSDIEKMLQKSTEFVSINTFHTLSRVYNTARAVIKNKDSYEMLKILCTDTSSGYEERGILTFTGLGAYPWSTKSGYAGITAFLYCNDDNKLYTYSSSLAYIHEKTKDFNDIDSLTRSFKSHEHWQNYASMVNISGSAFKLFNCKTNPLGRISSSKNTVMNVLGCTTTANIGNLNLSPEKYMLEENNYDYFSVKQTEKVCIIYADRFAEIHYNKTQQLLEFVLSDGEKFYECEILWTNQNKNAVSYIETLARKGIQNGKFFVCRYIDNIFIPVSIVNDDGIKSFYFD